MPARTFSIAGEELSAGDVNKALLQLIQAVWDTTKNTVQTGVFATSGSQGVVSVSTSAVQVLAANTNRLAAYICNNSNTTAWVGFTSDITAGESGNNSGYLAQGDILDCDYGNITYTGGIFAICSSGSANVAWAELTS